MKKCAIITPGFLPVPAIKGGAVETLITTLIELNEKEKKFKFDVFTIGINGEKIKQKYNYSNINVIEVSKLNIFIEKFLNKIFSVLNINKYISKYIKLIGKELKKSNEKYDYILVENNMYLYDEVIKNYKYKTKYIYHLHNDIGGRDKPIELCKSIANTAYCVLAVSDFLSNKFKEMTGRNSVKTYYNCIEVERFNIKDYSKLREKIGIKKQDIIFMYVGRFEREKGLLELIKSFKGLANKYDNIKLLVVGDNTNKNRYTRKVFELSKNMEDKIKFIGFVKNNSLVNYYNISDVVVIPSMCDEAFGIVAIESMLSKKPIIASNRGGIPEVVNEECAILINKDNFVNELDKAMEVMINSEKYRRKMGDAGHNRFFSIKEFDSNYYLKTFENIIK